MKRSAHVTVTLGSILVIAAALTGCTSPPVNPANFQPPIAMAPPGEYLIRPGDSLDIKFYYHPDHNQDNVLVRQDGKIDLPLVGDVQAADLTPSQLNRELVRRYSSNLRNPEIAVRVRTESVSQRVFVGGEVLKPGFLVYRPGMTAVQAIIEVGGTKESAAVDTIVLLQKVGEPNQYKPTTLNLAKVIEEGDPKADQALGPADIIVVPKSGIAKLNTWVEQYIIKMMPFRISVSPL
jgi:protein involved in polysaccharide export with SLBB domain